MQIIKIRAQKTYTIPRMCCVCGSAVGSDVIQAEDVSGGRTIVSLAFPICPSCSLIRDKGDKRSRIGCASGLGISALSFIAALVITGVFEVTPGTTLNCVLGGLFILSAVAFLSTGVFTFLESRKSPYRKVRTAVQIKGYKRVWTGKDTVTISFANEQFAELFKQLNGAIVLSSERK